jgi:predicted Zn-dependent peptidase
MSQYYLILYNGLTRLRCERGYDSNTWFQGRNDSGARMDIQKKEMKNGLVVASEVMPHLRSVAIGVWIRCGSRFEAPQVSGISHFIEHLLFKGTRTRTAADIAKVIDSVGGQLDAFTDKEYVGFYAKVLDQHLPLAFELLSDIVLHPTFPTGEIENERKVIFEEISTVEDTPQELIHELYLESFWLDHPLGRRIAGTRESVAGISRRAVMSYFKHTCHAARNTVIAVAGNISHRKVQALAERYFSDLPPGIESDPGPPPEPQSARTFGCKVNLEQTHICIGVPCPPRVSEKRFAAHLLINILGGGMSSRLFQNIREKRGLVYAIDSILNLYRDAGTLVVSAATAHQTAATVAKLILKEFRKLRDELVSEEELKRAQECLKGSLTLSLESSSSRMTYLAQQHIDFGRFSTMGEILDRIDQVRRSDVRRLAQEIFDSSLTLAALGNGENRSLESITLKV